MPEITDIFGTTMKNGTATLMARIVGHDAALATPDDIASVDYSIYLLDDDDPDARSAVTGHDEVSLTVADVLFTSLQTDDRWTVDTTGYNFRHTIDISSNQAFTIAGRRYLVEYRLTPDEGQVIIARFRVNVI
jgi:hypothetical protein